MNYKTTVKITIGTLLIVAGTFSLLNLSPALMQKETFRINAGESVSAVAVRLKKKNLIRNVHFFKILAKVSAPRGIKKGKYLLEPGLSSMSILSKFSRGDVITHKVTIPEGFNLYDTAERLDKHGIVKQNEFLKLAFSEKFLAGRGINAPSAEGYLFPDTYVFPEESDGKDLIAMMHNRLNSVLQTIETTHDRKINLSMHQVLTLASLIEKEARKPSERIYISAVFHNRLRKRIKLDCDPTVRYAVKRFTGSITRSNLKNPSPFNTYIHPGLPPTPICSPGKASIIAALNPAKTDFLYFVSRNDGSHYFSKNLKEHSRAVNFYQRGKRNGFVDRQRL